MSHEGRLLDRLTGRIVSVPRGRLMLGRYLVPPDESRYRLANRSLKPGDYLAGGDRKWLLWREGDRERWAGDFGDQPIPDAVVLENVISTAEQLTRLRRRNAPLGEWLLVSPLISGAEDRLKPHPLEDAIRTDLGYLQRVCREPHARLRTEHVLDPVSRTRRITWRTVVHLSAHSETWAARRLHGVEPALLLTPHQIADYDLYENRVVAVLVDRLWRHVLARTDELNAIGDLLVRCEKYLDDVGARPSHWDRERLYRTINDLLKDNDLDQRLCRLRTQVEALRTALAPLLSSKLRRGVRRPHEGQSQLNATNLLVNDVNYRHCRHLWNTWVRLQHGAEASIDLDTTVHDWCRGFAGYVTLLVLRALDQLGLGADDGAHPWRMDTELSYPHRYGTVRLAWDTDGTIGVLLADRRLLRIVPLPHALTSGTDSHTVARWLSDLSGTGVAASGEPVAVLYPAHPAERAQLPEAQRLAVYDLTSHDYQGCRLPALIPVGPSDMDSVSRVARLLRYAIESPPMVGYPVRIECPPALTRVADGFDWLEAANAGLFVTRPPRARDVADLSAAAAKLGTSTSRYRQQGTNREQLNRLVADIQMAAGEVIRLTICPICGRRGNRPERVLKPRAEGTFRCTCDCGSVWETRPCGSCGAKYPVLAVGGLADEVGGDGDHLDRVFGQDLLAMPCWISAGAYVCTACGHCPEAETAGSDGCTRCASQPRRP